MSNLGGTTIRSLFPAENQYFNGADSEFQRQNDYFYLCLLTAEG